MPKRRDIVFPYNSTKAEQVVLWFLHKHGGAMDKLKLVKLVFYADREHLARYGRPIVGGRYVAMQHGPVSSPLLDCINEGACRSDLPFTVQDKDVRAKGFVNEDELSESDIQVLDEVDRVYGRYDTFKLRDLSHDLRCWQKNYPDPKANTSFPLPYEDFFLDLDDKGMLEIVGEHQEIVDF